jgi:transcription elongation factor SPT6
MAAAGGGGGKTPFGGGRTPGRPGGATPGHASIRQVGRTPNPYGGAQTPYGGGRPGQPAPPPGPPYGAPQTYGYQTPSHQTPGYLPANVAASIHPERMEMLRRTNQETSQGWVPNTGWS